MAQQVDWLVADEVNYQLNPGLPEHRVAAAPGVVVTMRTLEVDHIYGSKAYGSVALDARDPLSGDLLLSCLLRDSVAVSATVVGDGVAYFAGRFSGDALEVCDGSMLASVGSGFTENHFILAWDLATGGILWSRNISVAHPSCEDLASITLDQSGRLWYYMRDFTEAQVVQVDGNGVDVVSRSINGIRHLGTISFDPWGGLYASGSCENGTLTFGGEEFPVGSDEGYNMYVLRFRPDGTAGFVQFADDITFQDPTVVATTDGHAYLAGSIFMETTWGDHTLNEPNWGTGVFITRVDSTGTFEWILGAQQEQGVITGDIGRADGPCIATDGSGRVYFLGVCRGAVDWGSGVTSGTGGFTDRCLTILTVSRSGVPQWALTSVPTTWGVEPQGITAGADEQAIHFAVHVADPFTMSGVEAGSEGLQAAVVGRVGTIPMGMHEREAPATLTVWPVPATDRLWVVGPGSGPVPAEIIHTTGQVVRSTVLTTGTNVLDLRGLAHGAYILRTRTGERARIIVE